MFAGRTHSTLIKLKPDEAILYRLPPMSAGPVIVRVFDAYFSRGLHDKLVPHNGPTGDLELELKHSEHLKLSAPNFFLTQSLWHDNLWRLRVRRVRPVGERDVTDAEGRFQYRIEVSYTSQLPILERRIPTSFFHNGFEANWNQHQYIQLALISDRIEIRFDKDLRQLYDLAPTREVITNPSDEDFGISFLNNVAMTSLRLDVGAGPAPFGGGNAVFFSVRTEFPAVKVKLKLPAHRDLEEDLPNLSIAVRFFLATHGKDLTYSPVVESNLLDRLDRDFHFPDPGGKDITVNLKERFKKEIEAALFKLQVRGSRDGSVPSSPSVFGDFLAPWLVGGPEELLSTGYAPGPGDTLRPDGIVEPATGELIVHYIGTKPPPHTKPVLHDPTHAPTHGTPAPPVDDGAIRLFDLPAEEPDPVPSGGASGGGLPPFGGGIGHHPPPDIGALAKIDHIVVLMQENRSFDQVLGYLSRDKINPKVDGLLPPDDPEHQKQVNRFDGRNFFPQKADKENPPGFPARKSATAWPQFMGADGTFVGGPCHDTDCVRTQIEPNPEAPNIPMGNFVSDFARRTGATSPTGAPNQHLRLVMDYFDGEQLKFYDLLAREFAISDRWYTSHPGPTWPNRFVLLTGDLNLGPQDNVETENPDLKTMIPVQIPTLFDHLSERGVPWRIFEHGIGFARVFKNLTFDTTNIVPFNDPDKGFVATARSGKLPPVTLIEPDYIDLPPGNDDHTPADMEDGQILVERIVKALVDSPTWNRTLLIITYDEHGGFYDHRPTPQGPPLRGGGTTLGPRVPAFLISPLVERGAVFFGRGDVGRFFDHTSIGATILRRFPGNRPPPRVSPRLDAARDLREALTLAEPRPRSDFDSIRQFTPAARPSPEERMLQAKAARAKGIGEPDNPKEDFHWFLSAVRLIVGEAPKVSKQGPPPPTGPDPRCAGIRQKIAEIDEELRGQDIDVNTRKQLLKARGQLRDQAKKLRCP